MAEAFAHMAGATAYSAGSKPSGVVNPRAIATMAEIGYDLQSHRSESIEKVAHHSFEAVVTMGCGDACPSVPARRREDWSIPDPKRMEPADFAVVRDMIRDQVTALLADADS